MTASLFGCLRGRKRGNYARTEQEGGDNTDAIGMLAVCRKGFGELLEQRQERQLLVRRHDARRRLCPSILLVVTHFSVYRDIALVPVVCPPALEETLDALTLVFFVELLTPPFLLASAVLCDQHVSVSLVCSEDLVRLPP